MKRPSVFAVLFCLLCNVASAAQLRESVIIVQPELSADGIAAYRSIADDFRKQNFNDIADRFESMADGKSSSGFIARDRYGRSVVVTNRRVVTFADAVTIILTWKGDSEVTIPLEHCRILYEDPDIDFALVLLPEGAFEGTPRLELAESIPVDGKTVWAAGYPSLSGVRTWRLGEGEVINRRIFVDRMGPEQFAVFTEHSATIDDESSGGPLLMGNPDDPSTMRVVGLNSWGIPGHGGSSYAVSLETLREAFARVPDPADDRGATELVRAKTESFITSLHSTEWLRFESGRYISSRMVTKQGWNEFISLLATEGETEKKIWIERILRGPPEEALRQALSYKIYKKLHQEKRVLTLLYINEMSGVPGEQRVRTGLAIGKDVHFFEWKEERGNWRISEAAILREAPMKQPERITADKPAPAKKPGPIDKPAPEEKPAGGYPFPAGLTVGFGVSSIPTIYGWRAALNQSIGYHFGFGRIASAGVSLVVDAGAALVEYGSQAMPLIVGLQGEGRIGVPLELKHGTLFPFIQAGAKAGISTTGSGDDPVRFSVEADLGLLLRLSSRWSVGLELGASFATDAGLRLEGIPIKLLLSF